MRDGKVNITVLALIAIGVTSWSANVLAAEAESGLDSTDPRIVSWTNRAIQTGRQASTACDADLAKTGAQGLLTADLLASDPDFSRQILIASHALHVVRNKCDKYAEASWRTARRDFYRLGLSTADEKRLLPMIEAGYRQGDAQARANLVEYIVDVRDFLRFLQSSGARWRGPGRGYSYATDEDAQKAGRFEARLMAARQTLLDAPDPQTLGSR